MLFMPASELFLEPFSPIKKFYREAYSVISPVMKSLPIEIV